MNDETKAKLKNLFYKYAGEVALVPLTGGFSREDPMDQKMEMVKAMEDKYLEFESEVEKLLIFKS